MQVLIPGGIGPQHLVGIRECLREILTSQILTKSGVRQVNLRLNESDTTNKLPVFIDWVGVQDVIVLLTRNGQLSDPGLYRFGDKIPSVVYNQTVDSALQNIPARDWTDPKTLSEKRPESKLLAPKVGATYQKFIGIIAGDRNNQRRCVGILTVGFSHEPNPVQQVEDEMRRVASWPPNYKSRLVQSIEQNFIVGGPLV